jgi:16S rRNA (adenine1518-N6/adenine1519-N6)-dimethyltransferase
MSTRQTQTYLRSLFAARGITPRHQLGQNFLIDLNLHDFLVREAHLAPRDVVLEVGCATGALTERIAEAAGAVVAVEVDHRLAEIARQKLQAFPHAQLIEGDILKRKHVLNPAVVEALQARLQEDPQRRLKLVANLPYQIATPLITNLLVDHVLHPALLLVTIQRELAERMIARPSTSSYGALSVLIHALADAEILRFLPPDVFWPRPKVESAILRITPDPARRAGIPDLDWFHHVVRQVFLHRRKHLRGALLAGWSDQLDKPTVDALLRELQIDSQTRPEALDVAAFGRLADRLRVALQPRAGAAARPGATGPEARIKAAD